MENELFLLKLLSFSNGEIHAIFSDNSSIIIHPSFEYFTYFSLDSPPHDYKSLYLLKKENMDCKINLIVSVYNLFSNEICPFTQEYVKNNNLNLDKINILIKNDFIYWLNEDDNFEELENEYFMIKSVDGNNKLFLFKNLRIIKVEYCEKIIDEFEEGNYLKICKFFSINNLLEEFYLPFFLLINHFNIKFDFINQNFIENILKKYFICNNEYKSLFPSNKKTESKIINKIINPLAFEYHNYFPINFIYTRNYTYLINYLNKELDIINNEYPSENIYTKNNLDLLIYSNKIIHVEIFDKIYNKENKIIKDYEINSTEENIKNDELFYAEICNEIINIKKYGNLEKIILKNIYNPPIKIINEKNIPIIKNINDFIFEGRELFKYKQINNLGEFYSYKNKACKAKFYDNTIVMFNNDLYYVCVFDKHGEKLLLNIDNISMNNENYIYIKHLMDFYDFCFNKEKTREEEHYRTSLQQFINNRLENIDMFNKLFYGKENNFSKEYQYNQQPTFNDIKILMERNEKMLKEMKQLK